MYYVILHIMCYGVTVRKLEEKLKKKINAFLKHLGELILKTGDLVRSFHLLGPTTVN